MSKSKGEFLTVSLLEEKGYDPLAYRYMVVLSHYQKNLEFTYEALDKASFEYKKLKERINTLNKEKDNLNQELYNTYNNNFKEAISNNLNTSLAITTIYDVLKSDMNDYTKLELIKSFDKVLSLNLVDSDNIPEEVLELVNLRNKLKAEKNYEEADKVRMKISDLGYKVLDTREGFKIIKL